MEDTKQLNQLSKEDLKQLEDDMKIIKEHYLKELEREKSERDLQATKDSQNAESTAKTVEKKEKEEKEELAFREALLAQLSSLESKSGEKQESLDLLNEINTSLITISENTKPVVNDTVSISQNADLAIIFFLIGVLPVIVAWKACDYFFRDIII